MKPLTVKPRVIAGGFALLLACAFLGAIAVPYGAWVGDNLIRIVALPVVLTLLFFFILDKSKLFLLIIFIRAASDPIVEATRFGPLSVGAVLNALIILIAFLLVVERPRVIARTALPMWGPLMLIVLFEAMRSPDLVTGIRTFLGYLSYAAVFTAPFYLKECQKNMRFCIGLVLLSSLVPVVYGFVDFAHGGQGGALAGRIQSTFSHPNIFAFYLVFVISLTFYLIKNPAMNMSRVQRCVLALYMAMLLVLLVLTKTRSAWAASLVVFFVYGAIFERRYLIYLAVGCGLALLVPDIQDRLLDAYYSKSEFVQDNYMLNSYEWRKLMWQSAWNWMQLKKMVFGYGLASFPYYSLDFFPLANGTQWSAHSVYVEWFFDAGVVGVMCAAWLFYRLFYVLKIGMKKDKLGAVIMMTVVIEYLVASYSDNMLGYLAFNWYFWFVMGTACAVAVAGGVQTADRVDGEHGTGASRPHIADVRRGHA
jgi:hypothetical protein